MPSITGAGGRVALDAVDDGGGAHKSTEQRGKVVEHEQAEEHGVVRLDQQRVLRRREQHRRVWGL